MTEFNLDEPNKIQIQVALETVLASAAFADANRLKSFLRYIVTETLDGRGANIRAKLIASDVYGRRPEDGVERESIVRVDAGRLRRRLDVYYSDEGASDEVRIHVLPGGYLPTFEHMVVAEPEETVPAHQANRTGSIKRAALLAVLLAFAVGGFGLGWFGKDLSSDVPPTAMPMAASSADRQERVVRRSVNQVSSASLLARTFVEEAHELIFPSIDQARLGAGEILCQRAIEIAPELSTGHSCDAFTQAYIAFVTPRGDARNARLSRAKTEAAAALSIDPADAYAQMAGAWTQFVDGERKSALGRAQAAVGIAPKKEFLRNFYGMMMAFDGQGADLILSPFPNAGTPNKLDRYHPFVMAGAHFQMGQYLEAIQAIDAAVEIEGRTSALMTSIQIAAYEASGDEKAAEVSAENLIGSWPRIDYEPVLLAFFSDAADALAISTRVDSAIARLADN